MDIPCIMYGMIVSIYCIYTWLSFVCYEIHHIIHGVLGVKYHVNDVKCYVIAVIYTACDSSSSVI